MALVEHLAVKAELFDTTEANIIITSNSLLFGGHWQHVHSGWNCFYPTQENRRCTDAAQSFRWTKLQILMRKAYCYYHRHHIPHLMLFDKDGPNLSCNHGDNSGDVIFKSVGEAASSRDTVLVEMRHMLSHAFHLFKQSHINTHTHIINANQIKPKEGIPWKCMLIERKTDEHACKSIICQVIWQVQKLTW